MHEADPPSSRNDSIAARMTYARAALAALIPIVLAVLAPIILDSAAMERAVTTMAGVRLLVAVLMVIAMIGIWCLPALIGLIQFRGSTAAWLEWRDSPVVAARRLRRNLKVAAAGSAVVLSLLVAEFAIRFFDLYDPDDVPQALDYSEFLAEQHNRLGIREDWDKLDPNDDRLRIAVLGDSIAYGFGVLREEGLSRLLETRLQADRPEGVLTMNFGFSATGPNVQIEHFLRLRGELKPNLVIHILYPNDLGDELRHFVRRIYAIRTAPFWGGRSLRVLHLVELRIRERIMWRETLAYYRGGLAAPERDRTWRMFESDVEACRDAAYEVGAAYGIVMFPWLFELRNYPLKDVHVRIHEMASRLDVPFLDLLDVFEGKNAADYRIDPTDEHPNAAGHQLAADHIAEFVRREFFKERLGM